MLERKTILVMDRSANCTVAILATGTMEFGVMPTLRLVQMPRPIQLVWIWIWSQPDMELAELLV